jgi:hypothetical protein
MMDKQPQNESFEKLADPGKLMSSSSSNNILESTPIKKKK